MANTDLQESIETLVNRLSQASVRDIYSVLDSSEVGSGDRGASLREAVIRRLNGPRTQHARRLFLNQIEPFIADDRRLLMSPRHLPGCIHRLDTGGIWTALSTDLIPETAATAADTLNQRCLEQPVETVLASEEANQLGERLRTESVHALDGALARPRRLRRLLNRINRERANDLMPEIGAVDVRPIDQRYLETLRALLAAAPVLTPATRACLGALDEGERHSDRPAAELVHELKTRQEKLRPLLRDEGFSQDLVAYMALTTLYTRKKIQPIAQLAEEQGGSSRGALLAEALMGYVDLSTRHLGHGLVQGLGIENTVTPGPLALEPETRQELERGLQEFGPLVNAIESLGRSDYAAAQGLIATMVDVVVSRVLPALVYRINQAVDSIDEAAEDLNTILWLLGYVKRLTRILKDQPQLYQAYQQRRDEAIRKIAAGFTQTARADHLEAEERLDHLVRLMRMCDYLDKRVADWMSPTAKSLVNTLTEILVDDIDLDQHGRRLVLDAVRMAKDELDKTKYWADADLKRLVEKAQKSPQLRRKGSAG